jgi:hypothetical protein
MFRAFGHQKSSILDGGLPRWEAEGFASVGTPPIEGKGSTYPTPVLNRGTVRCEAPSDYRPIIFILRTRDSVRTGSGQLTPGPSQGTEY